MSGWRIARGYAAEWWRDQKDTLRRWWWVMLLIWVVAIGIRLNAEFRMHIETQPEAGDVNE